MKSIEKLREYANLKDDWYIHSIISLIENEIEIFVLEKEIKMINELRNIISEDTIKKNNN
jgi:hypothetical protein